MNNIKIRYLLLSIALIPIVGIMLILIISLNQTDKINSQSTKIATNMLPSTKILGNLNTQTSDLRLEESEMIILKDTTKNIDMYNKRLKEINIDIETYRKFISSEQEGSLFKTFEETFKTYEIESKKLIAMIDEGKIEQATKYHFSEHQEVYNNYSELLLALIDVNEKDSVAASNLGDEMFKNSIMIIGLVFLVSILISICISFIIITRFEKSMKGISEGMTSLSLGDLNNTSDAIIGGNELAKLSTNYQNVICKLQEIVKGVFLISGHVRSSSEELTIVMQNTARNIQSELAQVEVISTAISELSSTSKEVSINAEQAENETRKAIDNVNEGNIALEQSITLSSSINSSVQETANLIEELKDRAIDIGEVTNVISSISDQINLLALNAAIEAARAGEHGRGFAVVADEVRNLAAKTQESTKNIQEIISALQDKSENANSNMIANVKSIQESKELSDLVKKSFDDISYSVQAISDINTLVATASREQYSVTEDIAKNVTVTFDLVNENVVSVNQTQKAAQELTVLANKQNQELSFFKLSNLP